MKFLLSLKWAIKLSSWTTHKRTPHLSYGNGIGVEFVDIARFGRFWHPGHNKHDDENANTFVLKVLECQ